MKIGRNDKCWCGSGKKYKKCHLDRSSGVPVTFGALQNLSSKSFKFSECLHPSASREICDSIINAHTIQKAGSLSKIVDSQNHVLSFYPMQLDGQDKPIVKRVGWKKASTFSGFCGYHDNSTFAALENHAFTYTAEQCFLVIYRAICHELYQKKAAADAAPKIMNLVDRGKNVLEQNRIQSNLAYYRHGIESGYKDALNIKRIADRSLLSQDYSSWSFCVINFNGALEIVSTGAPTPEYDTDGNHIQNLFTIIQVEPLVYGIVSLSDTNHSIIFGWNSNQNSPKLFRVKIS